MDPQINLAKRYKQCITTMFKTNLKLAEDMKADHDYHYKKLYENIPSEYHPIIRAADHFDEQKMVWIRKKILDIGNEALRDFTSEMENYSVSFIFK
jgi:hypothetical protein